jgi:hypothetical protein
MSTEEIREIWLKIQPCVTACRVREIEKTFTSASTNCREVQFKGIVQRILTGVESRLKRLVLQIFKLNFKRSPSREEHKTIFSGFKIINMALSGQSEAPVRF